MKTTWGICSCHGLKRVIVNKKGQCKQGRDENRTKSNNSGRNNSLDSGRGSRVVKRLLQSKESNKKTRVAFLYAKPKKKKIQPRRKCTGEQEIFKEIGQERGPYSQISGKWIDLSDIRCYSHVLSKGAFPRFRKYKKNIILKTPEEHHLYEFETHKIKDLPEWQWLFDLKENLKREYYGNKL